MRPEIGFTDEADAVRFARDLCWELRTSDAFMEALGERAVDVLVHNLDADADGVCWSETIRLDPELIDAVERTWNPDPLAAAWFNATPRDDVDLVTEDGRRVAVRAMRRGVGTVAVPPADAADAVFVAVFAKGVARPTFTVRRPATTTYGAAAAD
jgi:hypothetical protein